MKAYKVWVEDSDKGCGIVFAENSRKAKVLAQSTDACEDERYIDIRVKRLPELDKLYKGDEIGEWSDMELREALVCVYGWTCLEPRKEDCLECKLCFDVIEE